MRNLLQLHRLGSYKKSAPLREFFIKQTDGRTRKGDVRTCKVISGCMYVVDTKYIPYYDNLVGIHYTEGKCKYVFISYVHM